jgi:hypothetical protein
MKLGQPVFLEFKTEENSPLQLPFGLRNNQQGCGDDGEKGMYRFLSKK